MWTAICITTQMYIVNTLQQQAIETTDKDECQSWNTLLKIQENTVNSHKLHLGCNEPFTVMQLQKLAPKLLSSIIYKIMKQRQH